MSDDPDFSRRDFLGGLGAAAAVSATPADVTETITNIVGEELHPLATEIATNVWHLHEPYYAAYPNDFQDLRSEVVQYLTDVDREDAETFGDQIRAYRDAARLLKSGWTPPPQGPTVEPEAEPTRPREEPTLPGTPRDATRTITPAEHIEELRAEWRGSLDSHERNMIAAEIKTATAAMERSLSGYEAGPLAGEGPPPKGAEPEVWSRMTPPMQEYVRKALEHGESFTRAVRFLNKIGQGPQQLEEAGPASADERPVAEGTPARKVRPDLPLEQPEKSGEIGHVDFVSDGAGRIRSPDMPASQSGAGDATMRRDDFETAIAKLSAETGLPFASTKPGEYVSGIYRQSLTLNAGRFAVIDEGLGFALVPWTPEIDRHLSRHVTGVAQENGTVEWSFGRKRGLEI